MAMPLEARLDHLHAAVRRSVPMRLFVGGCRLLLALAFLPSGWKKLAGQRFTAIGIENPVGFFFEALYRTGPYYRFIGLAQVVAAVLLLVPRTATLGAWLFLPIVANVAVLTPSVGFVGTVFVTGPMLLACIALVLWDYDRFKPILGSAFGWSLDRRALAPTPAEVATAASAVFLFGAAAEVVLAAGLMLTEAARPGFAPSVVVGVAGMLVPLAAWAVVVRRGRTDAVAAGRAAWVSGALLGLALAVGVAWTVVHPEAGVAEVYRHPPLVLGAVALAGYGLVRFRRAPALAAG